MSDALENKAVEILDKSQAAIATFADKMTELAKQYGPDVADSALQMARVDAINNLVPGLIGAIVVSVVGYYVIKKLWPWARAIEAKTYADGGGYIIAGIVSACWATAAAGVLIRLSDVWIWVGIFEPKLWLAKRILGL